MKKLILTILFAFMFSINASSQIKNLNDLMSVSDLSVQGLIENLQYTWEIKKPSSNNSESGVANETYIFVYNKKNENEHSQFLKRNIKLAYNYSSKIESTNFISDDYDLLGRIIKNLPNQGFELKGKLKNQSMYEDGNKIVTIQIGSTEDLQLPNYCYSIIIIAGKQVINNNGTPTLVGPINKIVKKNPNYFSGTKKFCDNFGWYYLVTIIGNKITIKLYPDASNNYHKNKKKPTEIIIGELKNGKIVTKDAPEYKVNRFSFKDGIFYEINNEGGLNDYTECNKVSKNGFTKPRIEPNN